MNSILSYLVLLVLWERYANLILDRAMGMPIERPGSTTTDLLKKQFEK